MVPTIRHRLGAFVFVAGLLAIQAAEAQRPARPDAASKQQPRMTRQQFEALPPDHVLDLGGQRVTKRQVLARIEQRRAALKNHLETQAAQQAAAFQSQRTALLKEQAAKLEAGNAKTRQQFASLRVSGAGPARTTGGTRSPASSAQIQAIEREAAELYAASKTASASERARINKRAAELLQQLQRVPR
jgi:hypothetical protein